LGGRVSGGSLRVDRWEGGLGGRGLIDRDDARQALHDDGSAHSGRARRGLGPDHRVRGRRHAGRSGRCARRRAGRAASAGASYAEDRAQPRCRRSAGDRARAGAQGVRVAALDSRLRGGREVVRREAPATVPGAMMAPPFGLILANRAVVLGVIKARDLLDIAGAGEQSQAFDRGWVGDSLLAKPRLEAVSLLSALAGVTSRVRLGVGCLATFVHRHPVLFAQQWASLDQLSNGRAWLAVCLGGPDEQSKAQALEHSVMQVRSSERVGRLEDGVVILRKPFAEKNVAHAGEFYRFQGVTVEPRPVQQPCPIWIASNPTGLTWKGGASASDAVVERSFRRVARFADGWMSNKLSPEEFRRQFGRI